MFGQHCLKSWSVSQQVIALSYGEVEYDGIVKGVRTSMCMQGMIGDLGVKCGIVMCTDASAAKAIASRRGLGKVRHIELA